VNPWPVKRWILKILVAGFFTAVIWSSTAWILGVMFLATVVSFTWWQLGRDQERARKKEG
jgi:Flp pilus assembly protein TadB